MKRFLPNLEATHALGAQIARVAPEGLVVALSGDLGTGKSSLVRGAARALGWCEDVPSPTFLIVHVLDTVEGELVHADLYRIEHADELEALGFESVLDGCRLAFVEWPEVGRESLGADVLDVALADDGSGRCAQLTAHGPKSLQTLEALRHG